MRRITCSFWTLATLVLAGCQIDPPNSESFFPPPESSSTAATMELQAARGARADAMLHEVHFDGRALNSLGMSKLDGMLCDVGAQRLAVLLRNDGGKLDGMPSDADASLPLVVYLNVPEPQKDRRAAVETYLKDKGLKAAQYRIEAGVNPAAGAPAAKATADLQKTESTPSGAASGVTVSGGASGTTSSLQK